MPIKISKGMSADDVLKVLGKPKATKIVGGWDDYLDPAKREDYLGPSEDGWNLWGDKDGGAG
jgi:hypothetical protein